MNKIDYIIVNILLRVCNILAKYSEKVTTTDIYTIGSLLKEELKDNGKNI